MTPYTYVAAWAVDAGFLMSRDGLTIELLNSDVGRFVLTREPADLLAEADRERAIGSAWLRRIVGQLGGEFEAVLPEVLQEIIAERGRLAGDLPVLVFEAHGEAALEINPGHAGRFEGFTVVIDGVNKQLLRSQYRPTIEAMKLAISLESRSRPRFRALADGFCFRDWNGEPVYSLTFSSSAEATAVGTLTADVPDRISARFASLQGLPDLRRVQSLFSDLTDTEDDRLRAFLSGWAALEVLIQKAFKSYEEAFLAPLVSADQPQLRERFLQRLREVMRGKYRLADKFLAVSAVLFTGVPDPVITAYQEQFLKLKGLRDSIYHGEEFSEKNLPIQELSTLLRDYLTAWLDAATRDFSASV